MGRFDFWRSARWKQADRAADEIYAGIAPGHQIRIPQSFEGDDPLTQTVLRLQQKYPDTQIVLQSDCVLVSRKKAVRAAMSPEAHDRLDAHGYFPDNRLPLEMLLASHAQFMARGAGARAEVAKQKAEEARKRDQQDRAIVLGAS